ncbi:hypothetical protein HN51_069453 [Arachis hypogaea]
MRPLPPRLRHCPTAVAEAVMSSLRQQGEAALECHRLRLGKYKRDLHSLQKERKNLQAVWSPEGKLITIPEC